MCKVAIGFGSNLGPGPETIRAAVGRLCAAGLEIVRMSPMYKTSPVGPQDQPDFTNAVALMTTDLSAWELLDLCKRVETDTGRMMDSPKWGPRIIDIDILLYGRLAVDEDGLVIPHRELKNRLFVLIPLLETAPEMCLPDGAPAAEFAPPMISALSGSGQKIVRIVEIL